MLKVMIESYSVKNRLPLVESGIPWPTFQSSGRRPSSCGSYKIMIKITEEYTFLIFNNLELTLPLPDEDNLKLLTFSSWDCCFQSC